MRALSAVGHMCDPIGCFHCKSTMTSHKLVSIAASLYIYSVLFFSTKSRFMEEQGDVEYEAIVGQQGNY